MANEYIIKDSNFYKKLKTFKYLGSLITFQNLDEEITRIQSRTFVLLFSKTLVFSSYFENSKELKFLKQ